MNLAQFIALLGERWSLPVLNELRLAPRRFSEMKRAIPNVSQRMLAQATRRLEAAKLVERTELSKRPPRVLYNLSPTGTELIPYLDGLQKWLEVPAAVDVT